MYQFVMDVQSRLRYSFAVPRRAGSLKISNLVISIQRSAKPQPEPIYDPLPNLSALGRFGSAGVDLGRRLGGRVGLAEIAVIGKGTTLRRRSTLMIADKNKTISTEGAEEHGGSGDLVIGKENSGDRGKKKRRVMGRRSL